MSVLWLIISVCECCSLLRQDCLPLPFVHSRPLFLMGECAKLLSAHMAPGGRVGVPCSLCKHANVLQSGGSTAAMEAPPSTPPTLSSPITEFGSEDVKQTRCKWHFYLLVFASPSPPQHPSFTGIRSAISRSPMATAGLVNEGDNFLMMSPRHVIGGLLQRDRTRPEIQIVLIFGLRNWDLTFAPTCGSGYVSYNLTISLWIRLVSVFNLQNTRFCTIRSHKLQSNPSQTGLLSSFVDRQTSKSQVHRKLVCPGDKQTSKSNFKSFIFCRVELQVLETMTCVSCYLFVCLFWPQKELEIVRTSRLKHPVVHRL